MSNRVHLNAVKIEYLNGSVTYGYTISDDNEMTFENNAEAMIQDDMELLRYAKQTADSVTEGILDFVRENEKGILINDSWYDWDDIKKEWES